MPDYASALRELLIAIEGSGLTYALGGANALAVWAVPRATLDIDITLWCEEDDLEATFSTLRGLGAEVPQDLGSAREDGVVYARWHGIRLDVFVPSIPFYDQARAQRVHRELPGIGPVWLLSAETLAVFKMLFFRGKDLLDVEKIVRVRGEDLDTDFIRAHLVQMVGDTDRRVIEWDAMLVRARNRPGPK